MYGISRHAYKTSIVEHHVPETSELSIVIYAVFPYVFGGIMLKPNYINMFRNCFVNKRCKYLAMCLKSMKTE